MGQAFTDHNDPEAIPMNSEKLEHRAVRLGLRAPRVVIVFPGDSDWTYWARLALAVANRYWGGSGFVLAPARPDGEVAPKLLGAMAAYDPDYVVALAPTVRECQEVLTDILEQRYPNGALVGVADSELERLLDEEVNLRSELEPTRKSVASHCAAYRMRITPVDAPHERLTSIGSTDRQSGPLVKPRSTDRLLRCDER
ncbi:hypothetical protein, partial [Gordonia sp. i37]|uniref:hypothetical protein n=1 Tax=Gordonia sp. i37 TaxID=1961707 RepID=UPI001C0ADA85